jgi:hypothetical protein
MVPAELLRSLHAGAILSGSMCYIFFMKRLVVLSVLVLGGAACSKGPEKTAAASNTPLPPAPKETKTPPPPEPVKQAPAKVEPTTPTEAGATAPDAKAGPAAVQKFSGQGYELELETPTTAAAGAKAVAKLVLKPTTGYHLNKEFPTNLKVKPPAGVKVDKAEQGIADAAKFEEKVATFEVAFTSDAGAKEFAATFKFAVCTESTCDPKREKLAWKVDVK